MNKKSIFLDKTEPICVIMYCESCGNEYDHTFISTYHLQNPQIQIIDGFCEWCKMKMEVPGNWQNYPTIKNGA